MAAQNITLNTTTPAYPTDPGDAQNAPQVVVRWDPSFAGASSLTFQLVVTDNLGVASLPATVTVKVRPKPVASLGGPEAAVAAGTNIALDGSASTPPGDGISYQWTLVT